MLKLILATRCDLSLLAGCLALGWLTIAAPVRAQSPASATRLQSLVNDAAIQVQMSYRQDPAERDLRRDELGRAIAAWNKSARSEADNERLAEWLRGAMRASMPGSHEPLPVVPEFQRHAPPAERTAPSAAGQSLKSLTKPPAATSPSGTAEPTPFGPATSNGTATHGERAEKGTAEESKDQHEALPTFESTWPGGAKEQPTAVSNQPVIGTEHVDGKQPTEAGMRTDDKDGDPFRDDPLPTDK